MDEVSKSVVPFSLSGEIRHEYTLHNTTMDKTLKPYEIRTSDVLGRHLTAVRPIKAGEVIITELPVACGPPTSNGVVCLGCYRKISSSEQYRCSGCLMLLCSAECEGLFTQLGHSRHECDLLRKHGISQLVEKYDEAHLKVFYEIMFPLRCLLLKNTDSSMWAATLALESHNELRKEHHVMWTFNQVQIVDRIRNEWNIKDFLDEEIHTMCGIIKVNCFGIGRQGNKGRALYPITSIMAHDCCPNVRTAINPQDHTMSVRALRDIAEGENITTSYVDYILGTLKRREILKNGKFFWCTCRRCSDPTEFGTDCSALKCFKCMNGIVLPVDPLAQNAHWQCLQCKTQYEVSTISTTLEKLFRELDSISTSSVSLLEDFLKKYQRILGDNHYLNILAKYNMCQLYNLSQDFTEAALTRREQCCRDVLKIIDVLKPGLSLVRAIAMFNLHIPLISLAKIAMNKQEITHAEFRARLLEAAQLLQESEYILKLDPHDPRELDMARLAKTALVAIKSLLTKYTS